MAKKGVCLARCTGELHPVPSGKIHQNSEVLELLTFQRAEQHCHIALWRPPQNPLKLPQPTLHKSKK